MKSRTCNIINLFVFFVHHILILYSESNNGCNGRWRKGAKRGSMAFKEIEKTPTSKKLSKNMIQTQFLTPCLDIELSWNNGVSFAEST